MTGGKPYDYRLFRCNVEGAKDRAGQKAVNFQSVIGLSEYSELEYLDNSVTLWKLPFVPRFRSVTIVFT